MEPLRTLRRTSAFTHTSALNVCFGGASYDGFVFVSGETHAGEAGGGVAEVSCTTGSTSVHSYGIAKVTVPVRKGETVQIAAKGELGVYAGFIPAKAST